MLTKYIHREIEPILKESVKQFSAVAVCGPRQSGKSTLLQNVFPDYQYVTLDDPLRREQAVSDPNLFLSSIGEKTIIDEIQYAPGLLSYVKIQIDQNREKKGLYIFTGSQQFPLIKDLGDSLAGRVALLDLLPFCVSEKCTAPDFKIMFSETKELFIQSCLRGSYPELVIQAEINPEIWYPSYIRTYLERDIRSIYDIGSLREFHQFMRLLAARCSQVLNMSSFATELGVTVNTIKRWLSILEASRIIYILQPFYRNLGKRLTKSPKVYFLDCALACHLAGIKNGDQLLQSSFVGAFFENFCIQETIKSFLNRGLIPTIYYIRTHNQLEVDLIIEGLGLVLFPIEIKFTQTPKLSMARQIHRFKKTFSQLDIREGSVLSLSNIAVPLSSQVSVQPFANYLNWLNTL